MSRKSTTRSKNRENSEISKFRQYQLDCQIFLMQNFSMAIIEDAISMKSSWNHCDKKNCKTKKRLLQDLNLRGNLPIHFECITLTTRSNSQLDVGIAQINWYIHRQITALSISYGTKWPIIMEWLMIRMLQKCVSIMLIVISKLSIRSTLYGAV